MGLPCDDALVDELFFFVLSLWALLSVFKRFSLLFSLCFIFRVSKKKEKKEEGKKEGDFGIISLQFLLLRGKCARGRPLRSRLLSRGANSLLFEDDSKRVAQTVLHGALFLFFFCCCCF